jgi:hypothetical protein
MLGHLEMSVDETIEALTSIAFAVFPPQAHGTLGHYGWNVHRAVKALLPTAFAFFLHDFQGKSDPEANMKSLKGAIEDLLRTRGLPVDLKMHDERRPTAACKMYVSR